MAINTTYADFLRKRKTLTSLIDRQLEVLQALDMIAWKDSVTQLKQRVLADNFKVLVMGEFNRGKSTFINALLGQEILPAYAIPTTAIINEVRWGEEPEALLHYRKSKDGSSLKPKEVPIDQIEQYVVIPESSTESNDQGIVYENPFEKIELFWPLELCRDGVEIIDSPGLNEDEDRQKITMGYLSSVDAAIFIIACDFPVSRSEILAIETIRNFGHENIFFICNRINTIIRLKDQKQVIERCNYQLSPLTKQGTKNIFFINALGALEGRINGDRELLNASNLLSVEAALKSFLANERGRVKLIQPATELKASIHESRRTLPEREKLLRIDLETIQRRYIKTKEELSKLEYERQRIVARLDNFRLEMKNQVSKIAEEYYRTVPDNVEVWLKKYEAKHPLKLYEVFSKEALKRVVGEITTFVANEVNLDFKNWQSTTLHPFLTEWLGSLAQELDERTKKFGSGLEHVRNELILGTSLSTTSDEMRDKSISPLERLISGISGINLVDPASVTFATAFSFIQMMQSIIPQVLIVTTTVAFAGWNPLFIIPAILLGGGIQAFMKADAVNRKIQDVVKQECRRSLWDTRFDRARSIADGVDKILSEIRNTLNKGLGLEIQNIRDQVDSIISEKQLGQARVDEAIRSLSAISDELEMIDSDIDILIKQVALSK